ncbi:MAG: hypothetical protein KIT34_08415 [Cyanobacteria bacterium TGS_CYA1]|nr:hypothetical protein [Cyanobacteria bacterium TGS_CYA1]
MVKPYHWLIVVATLSAQTQLFAHQAQAQTQRDPGASGVIDGTDVYQFFNSGPMIDPTRMEEASLRGDKVIKMPSRHQTKSWQEVIDRDKDLESQAEVVRFKGDLNSSPNQNPLAAHSQQNGSNNNTGSGIAQDTKAQKPHHTFVQKLENGFIRASEAVGFPIADEPLPGDVDSSLAGDLPAGQDPRVYVHEGQPAMPTLNQLTAPVKDRETSSNPPTVIME